MKIICLQQRDSRSQGGTGSGNTTEAPLICLSGLPKCNESHVVRVITCGHLTHRQEHKLTGDTSTGPRRVSKGIDFTNYLHAYASPAFKL